MHRVLLLTLSVLIALPVFVASAALPETNAVLAGAAFIKSIQDDSGGYGSTGLDQNMDAVLAVRASGYDPAKDLAGGKGPIDFLNANVSQVINPAIAAKAALVAKALGLDPKSVGGMDLVATVNAGYNSSTGRYGADEFSQSVAMLGLRCTGNPVPAMAVAALKAGQIADSGGWGFGGFPDPDTTSIALQALLANGVPVADQVVAKGLAFVKSSQGDDGGWGFDPTQSNTSSTAYIVQALIALGEDPESATYQKAGVSPIAYLLSQQQPDGSFAGFDPAFATNQVVPALAGRTFCNAAETPITRTRPAVTPAPTASPATPPPASATAAPRPPSAGNSATADGPSTNIVAAAAVLLFGAAALGVTAAALRR